MSMGECRHERCAGTPRCPCPSTRCRFAGKTDYREAEIAQLTRDQSSAASLAEQARQVGHKVQASKSVHAALSDLLRSKDASCRWPATRPLGGRQDKSL